MDRLADQLRRFDGRSVEPFREALDWLPDEPEILDDLIELGAANDEPGLEVGAAWLIKERLGKGTPPPDGFSSRLVKRLVDSVHPIARLNLLQGLQYVRLTRADASLLYRPLLQWIEDDWAFIRAWAYDALWRVGQVDARKQRAIDARLDAAMIDEKASVRARIRRVRAALRGARSGKGGR